MTNALYTELTVANLGTDCPASAAWLQAKLRQMEPMATNRAEAYWEAACETTQYNIGEKLGWSEPSGCATPVADAIYRDFELIAVKARQQFDFAA